MSIFELDPLHDARWKALVEWHPQSSIFHRSEWLHALQSAYGYKPAAVTTCHPEKPLTNALVFCRIRSHLTGNRFVALPFSDHCDTLATSSEECSLLSGSIEAKVDGNYWKYLELRPASPMPGLQNATLTGMKYILHRLDLRCSENELYRGLHKDCVQRKIRRAERESLRYLEGSSDLLLDKFYTLFVGTRRRHGLPPQPLRWFRSLTKSFGDNLKIRVALKGDLPIASIITLSHRKTMTFKYGCSDARFNNLGGTVLLLWQAIREARAEGFEEFDMGRSDPDNAGLVAFKDHWGANRSTLTYYRYPASPAIPGLDRAVKTARRLMAYAPPVSLKILGNLLYRHIG